MLITGDLIITYLGILSVNWFDNIVFNDIFNFNILNFFSCSFNSWSSSCFNKVGEFLFVLVLKLFLSLKFPNSLIENNYFWKFLKFLKNLNFLKFLKFWNFFIFFKFLKIWKFWKFWKFWIFLIFLKFGNFGIFWKIENFINFGKFRNFLNF